MHVSETKPTTEFWFEKILLSLLVYFVITLLAAPPKIADSTFHLRANAFWDEKTTHHVGRNSLYDSTDKDTPTSKG
jgi:hypothetical protein